MSLAFTIQLKQSHYRPGQDLRFEVPRFPDNRHKKAIRLSALCTGRYTKQSHKFWYRVHVATGWKIWPGCVLLFIWKSSSACRRCQQQQTHGHDAACHLVSSETLWPHYFIPHGCILSGQSAVLVINGTKASFTCTSQTIQNYEIGGSFSY
jgi:hypothetical protein